MKAVFDLAGKQHRLMEIEAQIAHKNFWDNPDATTDVLKERTYLTNAIDNWKQLTEMVEDTEILLELAVEESDDDALNDVKKQIGIIDKEISDIIEGQYQRALILLEANKGKLTELAEVLLDKEVIFKDNLEKIFGKRPFDKPKEDTSEEE